MEFSNLGVSSESSGDEYSHRNNMSVSASSASRTAPSFSENSDSIGSILSAAS